MTMIITATTTLLIELARIITRVASFFNKSFIYAFVVYYFHARPKALVCGYLIAPFFVWRYHRFRQTPLGSSWTQISHITTTTHSGGGDTKCSSFALVAVNGEHRACLPPSTVVQLVSRVEFRHHRGHREQQEDLPRASVLYRHVRPDDHDHYSFVTTTAAAAAKRTNAYFLFVEYSHPLMEENRMSRIEIRLEPEAYAVGNEILSRIFVLRFLSFQSAPFVFSEEYVLKIVNDEVEEFEIGWHDFILINDKSYDVQKMKILRSVGRCGCSSAASRS